MVLIFKLKELLRLIKIKKRVARIIDGDNPVKNIYIVKNKATIKKFIFLFFTIKLNKNNKILENIVTCIPDKANK